MFDNGNVHWCMLGRAFLCRTGHFCVERGFFVSKHAFCCRTGLFLCRTSVIMYDNHWGCLNNPIFSNSGLCAACWAHFMCHHELWPTSVSHLFSYLNSSLGFAGGKDYQKITIPIFSLVLQNFVIPGCFPYILFYSCLFSLLCSGWFVIAVCGSVLV